MEDCINAARYRRLLCDLRNESIETPFFLVREDGVRHNLRRTAEAAGGIDRLMPHVKTHRAPWIVDLLLTQGVKAFKCATLVEVSMVLDAGGKNVTWAYPTANPASMQRFVALAQKYPGAHITGLVDSYCGLELWRRELRDAPMNIDLRVDLDPGMGRTGIPMSDEAANLALAVSGIGRLCGWHVYDGHVKGDFNSRQRQVSAIAKKVGALQRILRANGIETDTVGGGSYTFNLWPPELARFVSPGSWTYSSAQHDIDLADLLWLPAAFVVTTVISVHAGTATLDAGCKAISPDKPLTQRFRWHGRIISMSEEHTVVEADKLTVGDRICLMPQHVCTTAYMYNEAVVETSNGKWERRPQLGSAR